MGRELKKAGIKQISHEMVWKIRIVK
jgi:hypothetical protein